MSNPRPKPVAPTRRAFLARSAQAAAALTATPVLGARAAGRAAWTVEAVATQESFGDGATVPFFRFQAVGGTAVRGRLPFLEATEGAGATLTLVNRLAVAIRPGVTGLGVGPLVAPGATRSVSFPMPPAGTYLLQEARFAGVSGPLGFAAVIVSRPSSGRQELWNGGPSYDREFILHYQDSDDRWNAAAAAMTPPNTAVYEPNYFTLNGLSYPATDADPDTHIACQMGERVLLRLSNSGRVRQSIHFHGYHVEVAARGNVPNTTLPPKDTVEVPAGGTTDLILTVDQTGLYPVHPHSLTAVTANGLYPYGQLTLIEAV
ncbi:MAG: multicopper oxidase domain-containing protein [Planctomycetes bacterium]|nr:multicopper oxidase domain-containing protein [Planctomycetota bacterium]MBL7008213.1 multicopper oxidase domain-containing protein [Planctomycetota bacterium]